MALLDYAVRADGVRAPWGACAGLPFLLWSVVEILVSHLWAFQAYGVPALALHVLLSLTTVAADGLVSNSAGYNVRWLRANGFHDGVLLTVVLINVVASQSLGFIAVAVLNTEPVLHASMLARFVAPDVLAKVAVNMAIGELLFTLAHRALHQHAALAPFHRLHHCCRRASWSTNLLFHPLDLAFEFGGPVTALALMHQYAWGRDNAVLVLSYLVLQIWYAVDHDEYLKLYHYHHHTYTTTTR